MATDVHLRPWAAMPVLLSLVSVTVALVLVAVVANMLMSAGADGRR